MVTVPEISTGKAPALKSSGRKVGQYATVFCVGWRAISRPTVSFSSFPAHALSVDVSVSKDE